MVIGIKTNIAATKAINKLASATSDLTQTLTRLSTGFRINKASDDAAGLAIVSSLNTNSLVFTQGVRNINDGISAANIAEGALGSLRDISLRQLELAEQAANGSYSFKQRQALNSEANALVEEYNRIVGSTTFNGIGLLNPNLSSVVIQAGYGATAALQVGFNDKLQQTVGSGTYRAGQVDTSFDASGIAVASGDFDGDGDIDYVSSGHYNYDYFVTVGLNLGNGSFSAPGISVGNVNSFAVGDLNGDGKADLVTGTTNGGAAKVSLGNSVAGLSFVSSTVTMGTGSLQLELGDFNNDGKLDLLGADFNGRTYLSLGNGNGTFATAVTITTGGNPNDIVTGDYNGDGNLDFVVNRTGGISAISLGNGNGTFQAARSFVFGASNGSSLASGDFNGDGTLDLIASGYYQVSILFGSGDGSFQSVKTIATTSWNGRITVGDFNGDGRTDFAAAEYTASIASVYINKGNGTFNAGLSVTSGLNFGQSIAVGDFNGDGISDIITNGSRMSASPDGFGGYDYTREGGATAIFLGNGTYSTNEMYLDLSTQSGARAALTSVTANLNRVQSQLGTIGAATSRLAVASANLRTQSDIAKEAAGRIRDADVAQETSALTRQQILQQSATSVLAQANQQPKLAIILLNSA